MLSQFDVVVYRQLDVVMKSQWTSIVLILVFVVFDVESSYTVCKDKLVTIRAFKMIYDICS